MLSEKITATFSTKVGRHRLYKVRHRTSQPQAQISFETDTTKKEVEYHSPEINQNNCPQVTTVLDNCLPFESIPGPRPSLPLIGTAWQYFPGGRYSLSDLHEANIDKFRRYGPVVKEEFQWRRPLVHLFDPRDFETMFRHQSLKPMRPATEFVKHYRKSRPDQYESPGLANMSGEEWLLLRRALGPVLMKMNKLGWLLPPINNITNDFIQLIRHERHPENFRIKNFQKMAYRLSLEAVYNMTLESRLGCLNKDIQNNYAATSMINAVQLLFEAYQELYFGLPTWKIYPTKSYKKLGQAENTMYQAVSKKAQEALEKIRNQHTNGENNDSETQSILQQLLQTKGLSDKEIVTTVIDFIEGGIFTVSNAFSFLLYHISRHPDIQEKLYKELQVVSPDGDITFERLSQLSYHKLCIQESFRLTPTIPGIARILPEDIVMSGYRIPAYTPMFCNFLVSCRDPDSFPDADKYIPERWMDGNSARINKFSSVPFGFGTRMCVGRRFAEIEMNVALAKIIHNFKIINTGQAIKSKMAFIIVPSEPISFIFKDR